MGKTQKYTEDQLMDAVVKFSEIHQNKIKATELAKWCRENVEGLEEVRDYHFMRPLKERDGKTGDMIERQKLCTKKIEEINKLRSFAACINTNPLLRASTIDTFMELPNSQKRKIIAETREIVDRLSVKNYTLSRENEALRVENKSIKSDVIIVLEEIKEIQKELNIRSKQVKYLMKVVDETRQKEILFQMGLGDDLVDLDRYVKSLQLGLDNVMNITNVLRDKIGDMDYNKCDSKTTNDTNDITEIIMRGIDKIR